MNSTRRLFALLVPCALLAACKPHAHHDAGAPPAPHAPADAMPRVADAGSGSSGSGSGSGSAGAPAFRDDDGHVHGPGGPVFMGRAAPCDAAHDHCLRPGGVFSVDKIVRGKLFRAVPVYAFEGTWYTWRGELTKPVKTYRTVLAGKTPIAAGRRVIFFAAETSSGKWADTEYEALVSSRWEAAVTASAGSNGSVKIAGFGSTPLDTVRLIVETK
jgi:hypothetical protein